MVLSGNALGTLVERETNRQSLSKMLTEQNTSKSRISLYVDAKSTVWLVFNAQDNIQTTMFNN